MGSASKSVIILSSSVGKDAMHSNWIKSVQVFLELYLSLQINLKFKIQTINESNLNKFDLNADVLLVIFDQGQIGDNTLVEKLNEYFNFIRDKKVIPWQRRIIKILKSSGTIQFPEFLSELKEYELFESKLNEKKRISNFPTTSEVDFGLKVYDIATDIATSFNHSNTSKINKKVFLAEVAPSLTNYCQSMIRELVRYGFEVNTLDSDLKNEADIIDATQRELDGCDLSIHMFGIDKCGLTNDTHIPIDGIQLKLASDLSMSYKLVQGVVRKNHDFRRIIWLDPNLESGNTHRKKFLEEIKKDREFIDKADILNVQFEQFKHYILDNLVDDVHQVSLKNEPDNPQKTIYLISDPQSKLDGDYVYNYFKDLGFKVIRSQSTSDLHNARNLHNHYIKVCNATIVCFSGNELWMESKLNDLKKARGFGRNLDLSLKVIRLEENDTLPILDLDDDKAILLLRNDTVLPQKLKPYLAERY